MVAPKKMKTFDQSDKSKKTVESMIKKGGKKAKEPAPPRKKKGKKKAVKEGLCLFVMIIQCEVFERMAVIIIICFKVSKIEFLKKFTCLGLCNFIRFFI